MGTAMIVSGSPEADDSASFRDACEFFAREAFVSKPAVKALHKSVLPWASRLDVRGSDVDAAEKFSYTFANEFRAVVAADVFGSSSNRENVNKEIYQIVAREFAIYLKGNTLTSEFVYQREDLDRPPVGCAVEDEVDGPYVIGMLGTATSNASFAIADTTFLGLFHWHFEALFLPNPIDSFEIDLPSFFAKKTCHHSIAEARKFTRQFEDAFGQRLLVIFFR